MFGKRKLSRFVSLFGIILFGISISAPLVSFAAVKDTDADGLTDQSEKDVYLTDPIVFDTDGDTVGDGEEVTDGTNPLDQSDSRLTALRVEPDLGIFGERNKFAWYFARATGIVSFILLTMVMVFGMAVSSRAFVGKLNLGNALELHRTISWLALFSIVLHFGSFFFDDFLRMTPAEALLPFILHRDFPSALGFDLGKTVALGIIAFYLVVMLIFTSEFRAKMSAKLWRRLHYSSFVAYPLFFAHGFMSGTDSGEWWMRAMYVGSVVIVSVMILVRIIFRNILPKIRARRAAQEDPSSLPQNR